MISEKEHRETLLLLPWYVNETLSRKESEMVLRHLAECTACQKERDQLYELQGLVSEQTAQAGDSELSFRRVMRRIESAEADVRSAAEVDGLGAATGNSTFRYLSGLVASFALVLVAGLSYFSYEESGEEFQTLSSDVHTSGETRRLELNFEHPIPAATMRRALIDTNSNIVSGPDQQGNYLVEVVVPNTTTSEQFLTEIRSIEGVEYARFASK